MVSNLPLAYPRLDTIGTAQLKYVETGDYYGPALGGDRRPVLSAGTGASQLHFPCRTRPFTSELDA